MERRGYISVHDIARITQVQYRDVIIEHIVIYLSYIDDYASSESDDVEMDSAEYLDNVDDVLGTSHQLTEEDKKVSEQSDVDSAEHLDDLDDTLSTSHQETEEDKEVSEQSDVEFTGSLVEHTGVVTNMFVQPTPLPTTAIERVADRAASVKSTNPNRLRTIIHSAIHDNNTTTTPAYVVDRDVLQPLMKKLYTGDQDRIDIFLRFMTDQVEVCPHDNIKCLTDWGTPTNAEFSKQLNVYAQSFVQASEKKSKSWTKTSRILFTAFAQIIWPKKWKLVKTKRRCLFGIRLKEDVGGSPSNTAQTSCPTAVRPRRISLDSLSSQSTSNTNTPLPRTPGSTNSRRRDKFTPYYDILENNHCYVIRVVLPLMDEKDAKGITFNCNLAKNHCIYLDHISRGATLETKPTNSSGFKLHYYPPFTFPYT